MPEILLIRHAESETNRSGIWNGRSDARLSPAARRASRTWRSASPPRISTSCSPPRWRGRYALHRAVSSEIEVEDDLIEIDLGEWEGKTHDEVTIDHGEELAAAVRGGDVPMGRTGETLSAVSARSWSTVNRLISRLPPRGRAVMVTHGGVLQSLLDPFLSGRRRRAHSFVGNTSVTRLLWSGERARLGSFNDLGHLGPRPRLVTEHLDAGVPVVALIRHGQTRANLEGRWQGQADSDLNELGHSQAAAFATGMAPGTPSTPPHWEGRRPPPGIWPTTGW